MFKKIMVLAVLFTAIAVSAEDKPVSIEYNKAWSKIAKKAIKKTMSSVKIEINADACKGAAVDTWEKAKEAATEAVDKLQEKIEVKENPETI